MDNQFKIELLDELRTEATQLKRSTIVNAADELKKEGKFVSFDTIYNKDKDCVCGENNCKCKGK